MIDSHIKMNPAGKAKSEDEFDLEELAGKLFRLFRKFFVWLFNPLTVLFSNWIIPTIAFAAGLIAAFFLYNYLTPVYKSFLTIKPADNYDLSFFTHIYVLEESIKRGETEVAAKLLGCSRQTVEKVSSIELKAVWKNTEKKDSVRSAVLTARVYDPAILDSLQFLVLRYLETTPHYSRIRQIRESSITQTLAKLNAEISEIDSMKRMAVNNMLPRGNSGFVYGEPINPVRLYEQALHLYKEQIDLSSQMLYLENFQLINGFTPVSKPYWPSWRILLPLCIGVSFLIVMVASFIARRKRKTIRPLVYDSTGVAVS